MNIGEGYRWNVPVITYGYDQSFLDYFGTNGIAAVESAIQILNDLPPASQIILTNYPMDSSRINYQAQGRNMIDLKSYALTMLVEHLGVAEPTRYVYCLHDFTISNGVPIYTVLNRNFDPETWETSTNVNGVADGDQILINQSWRVMGSYYIQIHSGFPLQPIYFVDAEEFPVSLDQDIDFADAVADYAPGGNAWVGENNLQFGQFFFDLTQDDVGGLAYLLNSNNIAKESLIPGVQGAGTNTSNFVNTALRPGVEKITFQRMEYISGQQAFAAVTNQYVDSFFTNGVLQQQTLQRVIAKPDILFTAKYIGLQNVSRTGTTNWVNNGGMDAEGPGVIQPPVVINFNQLGPSLTYDGDESYNTNNALPAISVWGSYDATTNPPVIYPDLSSTNGTTFHFLLQTFGSQPFSPLSYDHHSWNLSGQPGALFSLQTSTDLRNWNTIGTITNLGGTFTYLDWAWTNTPHRFFRTVPQ